MALKHGRPPWAALPYSTLESTRNSRGASPAGRPSTNGWAGTNRLADNDVARVLAHNAPGSDAVRFDRPVDLGGRGLAHAPRRPRQRAVRLDDDRQSRSGASPARCTRWSTTPPRASRSPRSSTWASRRSAVLWLLFTSQYSRTEWPAEPPVARGDLDRARDHAGAGRDQRPASRCTGSAITEVATRGRHAAGLHRRPVVLAARRLQLRADGDRHA